MRLTYDVEFEALQLPQNFQATGVGYDCQAGISPLWGLDDQPPRLF